MDQSLQEFVDSRGRSLRVDRELGILRGVKILGLESRNGRTYQAAALLAAVPMYEGAKVNVNHPKGSPAAPRDYEDRIGVMRNVRCSENEGLYGDLHFNPRHALADQLAWDAEHAPENVGFSHNVQARVARQGDKLAVEAITKVQSVDLVADPATTRGLFESAAVSSHAGDESPAIRWDALSLEELVQHRPDLVQCLLRPLHEQQRALQQEVDEIRTRAAAQQRRARISQLLAEYELPEPKPNDAWSQTVVSATFLESLQQAADEPAIRALLTERAQLIAAATKSAVQNKYLDRPRSREQTFVEVGREPSPNDVRSFVAAITR